ncbi:deoxyguanosinetriphosphate triphosphohydrolase [Thiovibrio frasassiensis]|jgi:dGTPase|uniref:Deoxyguanosinetriphosphate triphosphohydrolase n=1 Tax=Thiovibrio frasassiensis TaxID=2984131 RepID=A0A9X4MFW0_9BACT|nr:deoxyguanosinetriphosphate triphosphohydrolase [Thiovibrio frasassiensis]MDG4476521.1 deoxyguanosinetriphosphate triphosphohydrolase [Thiovibrio frasassiensis]
MDHSIRLQIEGREAASLAPYAALSRNSKGRLKAEEECPIRGAYQRDRDRIIHCKSFRRLKHKTQVFLAPTGDHYRTRLTHVLEVSQIARTISVALRLNGHLTEAIALGHDLGHTPFGHAGEAVLDELYPTGFRHYDQSLRVVNILEKKGEGLNLTAEVLDGIAKHSKGRREILPLDLSELPATMEGRVVRIADIIAYVNHDLDDAARAGIIQESQIPSHLQKLFGANHSGRIGTMVHDLVAQSLKNGGETLTMTPQLLEGIGELRSFLFENVYETNRVHDDFIKAKKVLRELYEYFINHDDHWEKVIDYDAATPREQMVCDFIAGMTDRYALDLYTNIFLPKPWSVM